MSWVLEHGFLLLLFALYTAVLLHNAAVGRRNVRDVRDYFVAGRNLGGVAVGMSFFATLASTNSYIGHAGKGYAWGLPWFSLAILIVFFAVVSWRFIGADLRRYASRWDALTMPDYLSKRFPDAARPQRLRAASAMVIVFCSVLFLVAIFKGAGNLFQRFLDIPYAAAVGLTLIVVMAYTSIGGFLSVVRTDVLQGALMLVGSVVIFWYVTDAAGGVGRLVDLAATPDTAHLFEFSGGIPFAVLLGIALSGSLKLLVDPRQLSRFFALRDASQVRVGLWVSAIGLTIVLGCLFPVGLYAHFLLDGVTDTDLIVPTLITDASVFPPMVADFLIVAIVAAAMSSMDSVLLVAASVFSRDLLLLRYPGLPALRVTRLAVVAFALVSAVIALRPPGGIVEITIFSGSLYAACFLPAVVAGLHWRRGTASAVLASMLCGVAVLLVWLVSGLGSMLHEVFPALLASCVAYWLVSVRSPAVSVRSPEPR